MISTTKNGFTLLELIIVIFMTVLIASVSLANFRQGEKSRRVAIAADGLINVLTLTQSYTLSGKQIIQSPCANKDPKFYEVRFTYTNQYALYAGDNCNNEILLENFTLPQNVRIKAGKLILSGISGLNSLSIKFLPPFGKITGNLDNTGEANFTTAEIIVEITDGSRAKSVTIDGLSGRIGQ